MTTKIVLVGAGSAMFGLGAIGDIFKTEALEGSTITLLDINSDALKQVEQVARAYQEAHQLSYTIEATTSREEALKGANFGMVHFPQEIT